MWYFLVNLVYELNEMRNVALATSWNKIWFLLVNAYCIFIIYLPDSRLYIIICNVVILVLVNYVSGEHIHLVYCVYIWSFHHVFAIILIIL